MQVASLIGEKIFRIYNWAPMSSSFYCLNAGCIFKSYRTSTVWQFPSKPISYYLSPSAWLWSLLRQYALIARFTRPTWGPSGAHRIQVGPMLAPWSLLSGWICYVNFMRENHYLSSRQWENAGCNVCLQIDFVFFVAWFVVYSIHRHACVVPLALKGFSTRAMRFR